jgi:hypothetical protein
MQKTRICIFVIAILLLTSLARADDVEGRWMVSLQDKQRTLVGLLEVEKAATGWTAYFEGGPATVETDGDNVVIRADSRDIKGFVFDRKMIGKPQDKEALPPKPVDISGTWAPTQELDFRKYTMALTSAGEAWLESYLPYYDQPDVRCTSVGLPAVTTYSFPFEIIVSENRYTILYEYESLVRRIWMDGRQPSDFMPPSRMGHSNGHWEGSTLVITTTSLEKNIRDFRGELISENARIEERYDMSEDGNTLTMVVAVHDPENYARPPIRRRKWVRNDEAEIFPYNCDPDSFYIKMYEDGEMDMYIERADKRF